MKERGIIMTGESVRAILEGRKTQTRRVIKPPIPNTHFSWNNHGDDDLFFWTDYPGQGEKGDVIHRRCPYGARCTSLWVRETWAIYSKSWTDYGWEGNGIIDIPIPKTKPVGSMYSQTFVIYAADGYPTEEGEQWKPSIFMPRWASRITLEITAVKVERIQDISVEDMVAEGITPNMEPTHAPYWKQNTEFHFKQLWESINGKRAGCSWADNPWCWCIEFKCIA